MKVTAPVLVTTTEEVWQLMRTAGWVTEASVHLSRWPEAAAASAEAPLAERWGTFLGLREAVMKALEEERARGTIGSPLQAQVTLQVETEPLRRLVEAYREALAEVFVVSEVAVQAGRGGVQVAAAPGRKCERCWKHLASVGADAQHPGLCARCARVVGTQP